MKTSAAENLYQLKELLQNIGADKYTEKTAILSGASIGQHIRHVLEFYLLLVSGSFSGTICYDKRTRDIRIEENPEFAMETIDNLLRGIDSLDEKMEVKFEADYSTEGEGENSIRSSVGRELAYCIEHSIHHMAIIRTALITLGINEMAGEDFGVAYSTIRYRKKQCAQ